MTQFQIPAKILKYCMTRREYIFCRKTKILGWSSFAFVILLVSVHLVRFGSLQYMSVGPYRKVRRRSWMISMVHVYEFQHLKLQMLIFGPYLLFVMASIRNFNIILSNSLCLVWIRLSCLLSSQTWYFFTLPSSQITWSYYKKMILLNYSLLILILMDKIHK